MVHYPNDKTPERLSPAKLRIEEIDPVTPPFESGNTDPSPQTNTKPWPILQIGGSLAALLLLGGLLAVSRFDPSNLGPSDTQPSGAARDTPTEATAFEPGQSDDIDVAQGHGCAVTARETVQCWGDNTNGQLGNGTTLSSPSPVNVAGLTGVTGVSVDANHSCALTKRQTVSCWGANSFGQLGGSADEYLTPVEVAGLKDVTWLSTGESVTCAVVASTTVKCLGSNRAGLMGPLDSGEDSHDTPQTVEGIDEATAVSVSADWVCVIKYGVVRCWGRGLSESPAGGPVTLKGAKHVVRLATSDSGVCAAQRDGDVRCFDFDTSTQQLWPDVETSLPRTTSLTSGQNCAAHLYGVACWRSGRPPVHDDDVEAPSEVILVDDLEGAVAVSSADYYMCGLFADYSVVCTGENSRGETGDSIFEDARFSPPSS